MSELTQRRPLDIGAAIKHPMSAEGWPVTCLMTGLCLLIPLAGPIIVLGWQREVYRRVRAGEAGLPRVDIGRDLKGGLAPLAALMNIGLLIMLEFVVLIPFALAGGLAVEVLGEDQAIFVIAPLALAFFVIHFCVIIGANLIAPELIRRGMDGQMVPLLRPGALLGGIRRDFKGYLLVILGYFACQFMGGIGAILCYVGMFLTMPMGLAATAHLLAQWAERAEAGLRAG